MIRYIFTKANDDWLNRFLLKLQHLGLKIAIYDYSIKQLKINSKIYTFEQIKEESFNQAMKICENYHIQIGIINECPIRLIYPILTIVQNEKNLNPFAILYPKIPLFAKVKDNQIQNQLKKEAQIVDTNCTFLYKKDYPNQDIDEILIQKGILFIVENYPFLIENYSK